MKNIKLADLQKELMSEFYNYSKTKVLFTKKERDEFWKIEKKDGLDAKILKQINTKCPSLHHQILNHRAENKNIQSAVFSECVYAQTFANIFGLTKFVNCFVENNFLSSEIVEFLKSYSLVPRYVYSNKLKSRMLMQAGAVIKGDEITLPLDSVKTAKERGGETISRYKINSLFFVYTKDCKVTNKSIKFDLSSVRQLNPTIAAKVNFKALDCDKVKEHYVKMF